MKNGVLGLVAFLGFVGGVRAEGWRDLRGASDLDPLVAAMGEARVVLLGEASHGTREFYTWRAEITRRLVAEHGFRVVAVEGDWAPLYALNRYIKGGAGESAAAVLGKLERWPQWMWANAETAALAEGLREWNAGRPAEERVGFYGMDAYAAWASAEKVLAYLRATRPGEWAAAQAAYAPLWFDAAPEEGFMRAAARMGEAERAAVRQVALDLGEWVKAGEARGTTEGTFAAWQAAKVVSRAKTHFRTASAGGSASWNARAGHMHETVVRLLAARGEGSRAVVWAHNTHIGDARATPMAGVGMSNIGEAARRHFGPREVFALGFATYAGEVMAGRSWGATPEVMRIPPAGAETLEGRLAGMGRGDGWIDLRGPGAAAAWGEVVGHRAIGVVYRPEHDARQNFVPTLLPARYDALVFVERSSAVTPLAAVRNDAAVRIVSAARNDAAVRNDE